MNGPSLPTPRQASRRHAPAGAALFALLGLLAAACGSPEQPAGAPGAESQEVYLQPVASVGPDPFTASSATAESAPVQPPLPNPTGQGIRTVNAATPGLYGGTQRLGSCDVEQQVRFLTEDKAKAQAFAEASNIEVGKIPEFLRGLTPVVLRADTRVTNHAFRDGAADGFQSVLQAGTAVLVDEHGMPRVRCGCGNPLASPRTAKGSPVHKGDPWSGYQANQVVVIEPTAHVINNLVIVNIADNTWIERKRGDDGAQDRVPKAPPPYDASAGIPDGPVTPQGSASGDPCPPDQASPASPNAPTAPAPGATDCPQGSQSSAGGNLPRNPGKPSNPSTRPLNPEQPQRPQQPPSGNPSDPLAGLPPLDPGELGLLPLDPDGSGPLPADPAAPVDPHNPDIPSDPYAPYNPADPNAVPDPDLQPQPSDGGLPLESA
ncbi:hypothetical protein Snoj_15670 [Streptomyces nojiriensis]|uniref:DUF6777 domain-containing protein n=1 Tax=Streptomyces nojiriensis TaxID=66374 RepID=A0ABQ3SHM7_9ACTN|nr:DUF6777 domain-containing protein [Streptomyces nojiriensis]QTI49276.1 hypothetical protein JYK04_07147 [Streptomyces nojiriensis]GGS10091.1 hypothetical protein GCM10010205_44350 [Streptomyces nojiriensis]GHI67649.1 hypothetical protein Snoj_15670 [Streptomyces nojiriensis]